MKSFEPRFLENQPITQGILRTVRLLGEYKGREDLYREQLPQSLETLRQVAIIQSTESSTRIEGVTAPIKRIEALVARKTTPRNRSEQEIAGYRDVLNLIHANALEMKLSPGLLLQLHRDLYRYVGPEGGRWKPTDNVIAEVQPDGSRQVRFTPVPAFQTADSVSQLHERFNLAWQTGEVEKLVLIPAYLLDFLCIHPFLDGNGRMARLLALVLLYRAGFEVGRFISLERIIEESRESYYEALHRSSQGWHEGAHNLLPWTEYFLGTLVAAYGEFEQRVGTLAGARGAKTRLVLDAIEHLPETFRMADVERLCPNVTREMIRVVINRLRNDGKLRREGAGMGAIWRKCDNDS